MTPLEKWLQDKPEAVKQLAAQCPPNKVYRIKETGQVGALYSYFENGTISITVTNDYGTTYIVFDLLPQDIEPIET